MAGSFKVIGNGRRISGSARAPWTALLTLLALLVVAACAAPARVIVDAEGEAIARVDTAHGAIPARPNILLIVAEDLSMRVGAFGDSVARTPRLDQLAAEGVRFSRVYTAAPVCAPSRAALITGMHQEAIGAQHMRTSAPGGGDGGAGYAYLATPPVGTKAFPELLRAAGYRTVNAFKTDYQFGEPFTIWDAQRASLTPWREDRDERPFFAMVNLLVTHESYLWPTTRPSPTPLEARTGERNARELGAHPRLTDPASVIVPPQLPDTPVVREDIARHYDNVAIMDGQVGEILDALRADGLAEATVVIWTTDHGDGLPHAKRRLSPAGLNVPMIVRFPDRRQAGDMRKDLVSFVDLGPSILALAGVAPPAGLHGAPAIERPSGRSMVFAAADRMDTNPGKWRAVVDSRFLYRRNDRPETPMLAPLSYRDSLPTMAELWRLKAEGGLTPVQAEQFAVNLPPEALYDLTADPDAVRNLAGEPEHAADLERLRRALTAHAAAVGDLSVIPERQMMERMWPGGVQPVTAVPVVARSGSPGATLVSIASSTPGALIGYRFDDDAPGSWRLYTAPFSLGRGVGVTAKAIRYGYAESAEARLAATVD